MDTVRPSVSSDLPVFAVDGQIAAAGGGVGGRDGGYGWGRWNAVGFWPHTKSGGGGGVLSASGPIRKAGGGGVLSASGLIRKVGGYDCVSGGPGYSTVVEFMRTGINRQRKRAAIIIKCGPKSYELVYEGGGGGTCPGSPPPLLDSPLR